MRTRVWILAGAAGLLAWVGATSPLLADMANVILVDGTPLRGDVSVVDHEIVVETRAGKVRYPRERVAEVEWLQAAPSIQADYERRFEVLPPKDVRRHYNLAEWLHRQSAWKQCVEQCEYILRLEPTHRNARLLLENARRELRDAGENAPRAGGPPGGQPGRNEDGELTPPEELSEVDIQRLKLAELPWDGEAEDVNVHFPRESGQKPITEAARADIVDVPAEMRNPEWERMLESNQRHEQLQAILQISGLKYADRIDVKSDPETFAIWRRKILPQLAKSCARSGCHGGPNAQRLRFPRGSRTGEDFAYTSFVIFDKWHTDKGKLINREQPDESLLLSYMLPRDQTGKPHPDVRGFRPAAARESHPRYKLAREWLFRLKVPHPDYELDYRLPLWMPLPPEQENESKPDKPTGDGVPQTQPAGDAGAGAEGQP